MNRRDALYKLMNWHLQHYANMDIQDVYKLLYQGAFGAEHLMQDSERARAFLNSEWQRVPADANEALLQPVSTDGQVVRVNIRRCKADGISLEQVWAAFYASAQNVKSDTCDFEMLWNDFVFLCRQQQLPFPAHEADTFGITAKLEGWPAKHHTQAYREANYPAYRVLLKSEFFTIVDIDLDGEIKFT